MHNYHCLLQVLFSSVRYICLYNSHCIKRVRIRSYSGPHIWRIFPHLDWIRRDTQENGWKMWTRVFPNNSTLFLCSVTHWRSIELISIDLSIFVINSNVKLWETNYRKNSATRFVWPQTPGPIIRSLVLGPQSPVVMFCLCS